MYVLAALGLSIILHRFVPNRGLDAESKDSFFITDTESVLPDVLPCYIPSSSDAYSLRFPFFVFPP